MRPIRLCFAATLGVALALIVSPMNVQAAGPEELTPGPKTLSKEDAAKAQADLATATDANTVQLLAFPNPLFRMLALEDALKKQNVKINWAEEYQKTARGKLNLDSMTDKASLAFAIGARLADGSIALMAKDRVKLEAVAKDAKNCAEKLGLPAEQILAANALARAIADKDWGAAFEQMGWIQQEIVSQLDKKDKNLGATALVACGAWMQGIRYASTIVTKNMDAQDLSNSLRGPALVDSISREFAKLPAEVRELPAVKESLAVFVEIKPLISIKRDELIPAEKLTKINELATRAVDAALK